MMIKDLNKKKTKKEKRAKKSVRFNLTPEGKENKENFAQDSASPQPDSSMGSSKFQDSKEDEEVKLDLVEFSIDEAVADEGETPHFAPTYSDGDLSIYALEDEAEIEELACRRNPEEKDI